MTLRAFLVNKSGKVVGELETRHLPFVTSPENACSELDCALQQGHGGDHYPIADLLDSELQSKLRDAREPARCYVAKCVACMDTSHHCVCRRVNGYYAPGFERQENPCVCFLCQPLKVGG